MNWKPIIRLSIHLLLAAIDLYCASRPEKPKGIPMPDVWG